jgi:hypothetical protein
VILAPPLWAAGSWVDDAWADGTWATEYNPVYAVADVTVIVRAKARTIVVPPNQRVISR